MDVLCQRLNKPVGVRLPFTCRYSSCSRLQRLKTNTAGNFKFWTLILIRKKRSRDVYTTEDWKCRISIKEETESRRCTKNRWKSLCPTGISRLLSAFTSCVLILESCKLPISFQSTDPKSSLLLPWRSFILRKFPAKSVNLSELSSRVSHLRAVAPRTAIFFFHDEHAASRACESSRKVHTLAR